MTEYLKREDVRRAVLHNEGDAVIAAIDALETVEIVRCRDCKWFEREEQNHTYGCCNDAYRKCKDDFYCADGERKDGDADDDRRAEEQHADPC